jgi:hypothetical protein
MRIIKFMAIAALILLCVNCGEDWVSIDSFVIIYTEYTGPNTARVTYKARDFCASSLFGDVLLYNKDDTEQYHIQKESDDKYLSRHRYSVDITVSPDWAPGDRVTVRGRGVYSGIAEFDVPEKAQ